MTNLVWKANGTTDQPAGMIHFGSAMVTPDGYTDADIKACGNDYCVWSKVDVGGGGGDDPPPQTEVNIYFDNSNTNWATPHIHYWGASESSWPGVAMSKVEGNIWKYACPAGTTGLLFNAGDGDPTKTGEFDAVHNHVYTTAGDQGEYQGGVDPTYPAKIYMVGTINNTSWATSTGLEPNTAENGVYTWNSANQVDAMGAQSWAAPTGTYTTVLDLKNMTVTMSVPSSVTDIVAEGDDTPAVYYNLMGVRVDNPSTGVYIVRRGDKVTKEFVK